MVTMVELEEQGPAMTALGSLLKLTEVFLWDDGLKETKDRSFSMGQIKPARNGSGEGSNLMDSECGTLPEDMELTKQINALGLPVSFLTNKEGKEEQKGERQKKGYALDASNHFPRLCGGSTGLLQSERGGDCISR